MKKLKLIKTVSDHINNEYRDYAIYSLESRGIPNFYDSLTPVQRFILQEVPLTYTPTTTVSGNAKGSGYHHGDSSLENSINNLTRDFLCSDKILDGDGFFGNSINPDAASARYTQVKLNLVAKDILKKYDVLNEKNDDKSWKPLKMEIPLGLCVNTNGIAVGYSCSILPRKLDHIREYLEGKRQSLKPVLHNFSGKISKNKDNPERSSWLIEPRIEVDYGKQSITILDISPTISYSTYLKRINSLIDKYNCRVLNDSREAVNIELKFPKEIRGEEFSDIYTEVVKFSTATVTENIVMIKDRAVLEYKSIEDYLDDYKNYREFLFLEKFEWDLNKINNDLEYLYAREKYLIYMQEKKRTSKEIEDFLEQFSKEIYARLDTLKLRNLNKEYLELTKQEIKEESNKQKEITKKIIQQQKTCSKINNIIVKAITSNIN